MEPGVQKLKTLVLCDLDGTLVLDNSFHVFMACFWSACSGMQRLSLLGAVLPRMLGRIAGGHAGLKRRILVSFGRQSPEMRQKVIAATLERLHMTRSEPIARLIADWRESGARIILATAAPDFYALPFAQAYGASCIATPGDVGPDWKELLSDRKAAACLSMIQSLSKHHVIVLTDHCDDLPLLALADRSVVQAAASYYDLIVAELADRPDSVQPTHIDPTEAQEEGGYWLWLDDRPHGPLDLWEIRTILSKHRHALLYIGAGNWVRIGPGQTLAPAVLRRDCPLPPSSRKRVVTFLRRRVLRDWLGIFH
jgi:phosphoserine phosphatase